MFHIGLRTLKTGLVVTLSVIISRLIGLEYPFFVVMTAIISMDKTSISSLKMGRNRVFGTFLGAVIGVGLSYIDRGNPFLLGLGVILLIQICNNLKLQGAITIGGIVMTAIMVHTDKTPMYYGFHRTLDTLCGATISFVVNMTVFPYSRMKSIDKTIFYFINTFHQLRLTASHKHCQNKRNKTAYQKNYSCFYEFFRANYFLPFSCEQSTKSTAKCKCNRNYTAKEQYIKSCR